MVTVSLFLAENCTAGRIRLVGGSSVNEGRVEICIDSIWGTVSDSGWDGNAARVVCRQLGYSGTGNDGKLKNLPHDSLSFLL